MNFKSSMKMPLPQNWVYPIGVEIVNEYLSDTENEEEEIIWFYHNADQWFPKKHKKLYVEEKYIELLHTHYYLEETSRKKVWRLRINSVPNNFRANIKKQLLKEALPRIKNWLTYKFRETEIYTRPYCVFALNNDKDGFLWVWNKNGQEKVEQIQF